MEEIKLTKRQISIIENLNERDRVLGRAEIQHISAQATLLSQLDRALEKWWTEVLGKKHEPGDRVMIYDAESKSVRPQN